MESKIDFLSKTITPNCAGIIWLTQEEIDFTSPGVYEFNYLLNGLITKSISNNLRSGHLFMAENFGRTFFIGHNIVKESSELENVYQHLNVVKNLIPQDSTVLIFNPENKQTNKNQSLNKALAKKFENINFKYLNFETKVSQ